MHKQDESERINDDPDRDQYAQRIKESIRRYLDREQPKRQGELR